MTQPMIPTRIDLPSGGWVQFADPDDLTHADRKTVVAMVMGKVASTGAVRPDATSESIAAAVMGDPAAFDALWGIGRMTATILIEAWHIPYPPKGTTYAAGEVPIPKDAPDVLDHLKLRDYDAIVAAVDPVSKLLLGDQSSSPDQAGVPGSPTGPAGG